MEMTPLAIGCLIFSIKYPQNIPLEITTQGSIPAFFFCLPNHLLMQILYVDAKTIGGSARTCSCKSGSRHVTRKELT